MWRVWIFFMRGIVPLLRRWLDDLLAHAGSRGVQNQGVANCYKQRIAVGRPRAANATVMRLLDMMPGAREQARVCLTQWELALLEGRYSLEGPGPARYAGRLFGDWRLTDASS
jgi:hypothetical protein